MAKINETYFEELVNRYKDSQNCDIKKEGNLILFNKHNDNPKSGNSFVYMKYNGITFFAVTPDNGGGGLHPALFNHGAKLLKIPYERDHPKKIDRIVAAGDINPENGEINWVINASEKTRKLIDIIYKTNFANKNNKKQKIFIEAPKIKTQVIKKPRIFRK